MNISDVEIFVNGVPVMALLICASRQPECIIRPNFTNANTEFWVVVRFRGTEVR